MLHSQACILPWSRLHISRYSTSICCYHAATGVTVAGYSSDNNKDTMWDIWNSIELQNMRKQMANNGYKDLCFSSKDIKCHEQTTELKKVKLLSSNQLKNIRKINLNFKNKKYIVDNYPSFLQIFLDYKCNLNCPHCFQFEGRNSNTDYGLDVVNKPDFYEFLSHAETLNILGGEATLLKSYDKIIDYKKELPNLDILLTTNGCFLEKKVIPYLEYIKEIVISVDGVTPDVYSEMRPSPSGKYNFEHLCHQLELYKNSLKGHDTHTSLSFTICSKNYTQMPDFVNFAAKYNIPQINIYEIIEMDYNWLSLREQIKMAIYQADKQKLQELAEETSFRGKELGVKTCIKLRSIDFFSTE